MDTKGRFEMKDRGHWFRPVNFQGLEGLLKNQSIEMRPLNKTNASEQKSVLI